MNTNINKDFSKSGLVGAIVGSLISTQTHKPGDTLVKKTVKTGLFAALGFAIGAFIEKLISRNSQQAK